MAMQDSVPSAQLVGNTFVEQYYRVLHSSPEAVYRFYQDSSLLSRPASDGTMKTVTTMEDAHSLQLKLFLYEVKQQQLLFGVRTFLKVYSTISLGKLATYMDMDEPTLRTILMT